MTDPIIFFCKHQTGCEALKKLLARKADIRGVIVMRSQAGMPWYEEVETLCRGASIELLPVRILSRQPEIWDKIAKSGARFGMTVLFTQIIPQQVIDSLPEGLVNFHPSLLPAYRGPHPINWAIINGETQSGLTAHFVTPQVDAGPMITRTAFAISETDTNNTLMVLLHDLILRQVETVFDLYEKGRLSGEPQDEEKASYYPMRSPEDGRIDFNAMKAEDIYNLTRALQAPLDGAFFDYNGRRVVLRKCLSLPSEANTEAGMICEAGSDHGPVIAAKKGMVLCTELEDGQGDTLPADIFCEGDRIDAE